MTTRTHHSRKLRIRLRLLRAAAAYRTTGAIPEIDDPYGSWIQSSQNESGARIWSVGTDGTDNGGDPGKDIVLDIPR